MLFSSQDKSQEEGSQECSIGVGCTSHGAGQQVQEKNNCFSYFSKGSRLPSCKQASTTKIIACNEVYILNYKNAVPKNSFLMQQILESHNYLFSNTNDSYFYIMRLGCAVVDFSTLPTYFLVPIRSAVFTRARYWS